MVLVVSQRSLVFVSVGILHSAENEVSLKDSHLSRCLSVPHSESPASSRLKLALVDLPAEDLPAVEVLESVSKLADVFGGVGEEHSVAVQQIVLPLPDILDAVQVLLLHGLEVGVFSEALLRNGSEFVVEKCEMLVEGEIELLQSLLLDWLLALLLQLRLHCQSFLIRLLSPHDSRMQKLVVDTGNHKRRRRNATATQRVVSVRDDSVLNAISL